MHLDCRLIDAMVSNLAQTGTDFGANTRVSTRSSCFDLDAGTVFPWIDSGLLQQGLNITRPHVADRSIAERLLAFLAR
jgi:hypothetical protein